MSGTCGLTVSRDNRPLYTGCLRLVHWDDPEGWDAEGGGRGVQDGEHMWFFCLPSEGAGLEACVSFLVGGTGGGEN